MKKSLLIAAVIALLSARSSVAQSTFRDVPDNHWAAAAVKRLADAGIVIGRPANDAHVSADETNNETNAALVAPRVKTFLMANPSLEQQTINVNVISPTKIQSGTVTLIGTVKNQAQRTLAAIIARNTAPDYIIVNQLKIVAAHSSKSR